MSRCTTVLEKAELMFYFSQKDFQKGLHFLLGNHKSYIWKNIIWEQPVYPINKNKKRNPVKSEVVKKEIKLKIYASISDATERLKSNDIEGIIIIDNEDQLEKLTSYQKKNYGILIIKKDT